MLKDTQLVNGNQAFCAPLHFQGASSGDRKNTKSKTEEKALLDRGAGTKNIEAQGKVGEQPCLQLSEANGS